MLLINHNGGRLGNSIFRLFANILFCIIYDAEIKTENQVYGNKIEITDEFFVQWSNDLLNGKVLHLDKSLICVFSGYFQHDTIYLKYKNEIINYITNNPNIMLTTHFNENYKAIDLVNYKLTRTYDIVIHLRLEDFIEISSKIPFVMNPVCIKNIIKEINNDYPEKEICLVLNKPTNELEFKYINFLKKDSNNIIVESNDPITDFNIMKHAKVLVCSCSTLSWSASFMSTTIEKLYFPNYSFSSIHETFKKSIENTILYDFTKCTKDELENIL